MPLHHLTVHNHGAFLVVRGVVAESREERVVVCADESYHRRANASASDVPDAGVDPRLSPASSPRFPERFPRGRPRPRGLCAGIWGRRARSRILARPRGR